MLYYILAGEASGDLHASRLMGALKIHDPQARFVFLGGDLMESVAGSRPIVHYRDMAFMGFSEVLRNLGAVRHNLRMAKAVITAAKPDAVIAVDYPSFNLKVAVEAHRAGIPVFYFISPKIWAWKSWRVKDIRRTVEQVYSILPFEPDFYARHHFHSIYVGNPSVGEVDEALASAPSREEFLKRHRLRDRRMIALLPGSRVSEIRNNLPIMIKAVHPFVQCRPVIVGAPGIDDSLYKEYGATVDCPVIREAESAHILVHSHAALVTSGTATLETALAGIPQVVCYRSNGSRVSYEVMKRILNVDYVSLPNLIADAPVVPEMLLHQCTPALIADRLAPLIADSPTRAAQLEGYAKIRRILGTQDAAEATAADITKRLFNFKAAKNV